jgi:O-antigen ligase
VKPRLGKLPWLLLLAAVTVPGLGMQMRGMHVFWVPEMVAWAALVPAAALLAWFSTRSAAQPPLSRSLKWAAALLIFCWTCSALLAPRLDLSLRQWLLWMGYPLLFFAVWRLAGGTSRRRGLTAVLLAYGAVSAVYALVQAAGLETIAWSQSFGGRAGAFLGNPNFLGGHLALLLPVALALALDGRVGKGSGWWRWLLAGLLALGLLLTQTRGAWIGAAAGCAVLLLGARQRMGGLLERRRKPLLALAGVALLALAGMLASQPGALARLKQTVTGQDQELKRRFFLMRKAAQLAALKPLAGVGLGNFGAQFPRVQVVGEDRNNFVALPYVVSEHAHNDFLQMAAEAGLPAALAWLALMALLLRELWRRVREKGLARAPSQDSLFALGVLGGWVALLVHGLANFPFLILPTQGAAWALAALALRGPLVSTEENMDEEAPVRRARIKTALEWLGLLLGLGLVAALAVRGGQLLAFDRLWWMGKGELGLQRFDQASTWLNRATYLEKGEAEVFHLHAQSEASREMIWNSIGSYREAHRLEPYNAPVSVRLGRALIENKLYPEAETVLRDAAEIAPNFYDVWEPLAAALFFQGKHAEAIQAYDWMIYFNINAENAYVNKAAAQGSLGQLPQALLTLRQAEQRYPGKAKVYVNLAITYLKLGMRKEAKAAWAEAARLGPSDPQVDQLRKVLH